MSMRQVYVNGLANVLKMLPRSNRLIYVSSASVYGQTDGGEVDETAPAEPLDESGRIVLEAENLLRRERADAMILRFAGIYGPGRLLRRQAALEAREPIAANPNAWLNLIHVDDGAAAILAAEQRGIAGEIYNVSDGHPVRRGDFYRELARLLSAPPPTFAPAQDQANRRIVSRRVREELGVMMRYPSFVAGLAASIGDSSGSQSCRIR
jgi:nucleoside-diphosphate-sugar epimerase